MAVLDKKSIIDKFKIKDGDTGSSQVQVALLTKKIEYLSGHLAIHKKDNHSKRGLMGAIARRRSLLDYLKSQSEDQYKSIISALGIRK
jgi:small subunit ribosomal protein S15